MNNQNITSCNTITATTVTPTNSTNWNVKSLTSGSGIEVINNSGNWTINNNQIKITPTISQVLTAGSNANGANISNVGSLTCNTLNYTSLNPPINVPALVKSDLITNNGTSNVVLTNPSLNVGTTSTIVDWSAIQVSNTIAITLTATPSSYLQVGNTIRIVYNTDNITATISSISGNVLSVLITAIVSDPLLYLRTNILYTFSGNQNGAIQYDNFQTTIFGITGAHRSFYSMPTYIFQNNSFVYDMTLNYEVYDTNTYTISALIRGTAGGVTVKSLSASHTHSGQAGSFSVVKTLTGAPLFTGDQFLTWVIVYTKTGTGTVKFQEFKAGLDSYYSGTIRGFTVPYNSGKLELITPQLVLSTNPTTNTGLEWKTGTNLNLSQVLTVGNNGGGNNITNLGSIGASSLTTSGNVTCNTLNYTSLNPSLPMPYSMYFTNLSMPHNTFVNLPSTMDLSKYDYELDFTINGLSNVQWLYLRFNNDSNLQAWDSSLTFNPDSATHATANVAGNVYNNSSSGNSIYWLYSGRGTLTNSPITLKVTYRISATDNLCMVVYCMQGQPSGFMPTIGNIGVYYLIWATQIKYKYNNSAVTWSPTSMGIMTPGTYNSANCCIRQCIKSGAVPNHSGNIIM